MSARRGVRVFRDQPRHSLFFVRLPKSTIVSLYCLCIQSGAFPERAMDHIFTILQRLHIVGIPLEHFPPAIQILSVVICPADGVLIDVRQLRFNPGGVIALFMEDGTHSVAEAMPGRFTVITNTLNHLVNAGLTHWLAGIIPSGENILPSTGKLVDSFKQFANLS